MKNSFAVTSALLLALTLGGSYLAYSKATDTHHEAGAAHSGAASESGGEASANAQGGTGAATDQATTDSNMGTEGTQPSSTPVTGEGAGDNAGPSETSAPTSGGSAADTGEAVSTTTAAAAAGATGATGESPNQTASAAENTGDRSAGGKTFVASCAGCHGANAEGGIGPALNVVKDWSLEQFTAAIRQGQAPDRELEPLMPRFSQAQLTDADVTNVFAHLKTF